MDKQNKLLRIENESVNKKNEDAYEYQPIRNIPETHNKLMHWPHMNSTRSEDDF